MELPVLGDVGQAQVGRYRFPRLALGAMRLLASDAKQDGQTLECFADPLDPQASRTLMRAAVEHCGIGYVDFARGYGARPDAGESYFREWMWPYPEHLLWATKVGYQRDQHGSWILNLCPNFIEEQIQATLKVLGQPIPLLYLVAGSTNDVIVRNQQPRIAQSFEPLIRAQAEGWIENLAVANVSVGQLKELSQVARIAAVQNKFTVASLGQPEKRHVLELCGQMQIPFVAWGMFQSDDQSEWVPPGHLVQAAQELSMSIQEASIAILLQAAPNLVALTGASRPQSLASSIRAANRKIPSNIVARFLELPE